MDVRITLGSVAARPGRNGTLGSSNVRRGLSRSASFVKLHEGHHVPLLSRLLRLLATLAPLLAAAAVSAMATYTILTAGGARQASNGQWVASSSHSVHPLSFSTAATHHTQPTIWERKHPREQHGGGLGGLFHHHNSSSSACKPRCKLRVALINDAPYHLEIVAGYMQILGPLSDRIELVWYQAPQITPDGNYTPVQLLEMQGFTQLLAYLPNMRVATDKPAPCDFAIFISPEYFEHKTKVGRGRRQVAAAGARIPPAAGGLSGPYAWATCLQQQWLDVSVGTLRCDTRQAHQAEWYARRGLAWLTSSLLARSQSTSLLHSCLTGVPDPCVAGVPGCGQAVFGAAAGAQRRQPCQPAPGGHPPAPAFCCPGTPCGSHSAASAAAALSLGHGHLAV